MPLTKARLYSALLALSAIASPALADGQLSFVAASNPVQVGSSVSVQVMITGAVDVYAYNLSFTFDPSKFQVTGVTEGGFLDTAGSAFFGSGDVNNTTGLVFYTYGSLVGGIPGASGSGTLATIQLSAIGQGSSTLSFVGDDTLFVNSAGNAVNVGLSGLTMQVTAVPEPSTYLMLLAGLAGVGVLRRRQAA